MQGGVNGRVQSDNGCSQNEQIEVPIICVDQFIQDQPGLVKIDVEGFEGQVLQGMQQLMKLVRPNIFVEVHPELLNYGVSVEDVFNLCKPYYSKIECWDHTEGNGGYKKLLYRYQPSLSLRRLSEPAQLIADCLSGKQKEPFWMICRS